MNSVLHVLKLSRARLTYIKNWCPRGPGDGEACCAMVTPNLYSGDAETLQSAKTALCEASRSLYQDYEVFLVNDGFSAASMNKSEEERHKMILAIYDKAIETLEKN